MQHLIDDIRLFDDLCHTDALRQGIKAVRRNQGVLDIDYVTISDFERNNKVLRQLAEELRNCTYRSLLVRC